MLSWLDRLSTGTLGEMGEPKETRGKGGDMTRTEKTALGVTVNLNSFNKKKNRLSESEEAYKEKKPYRSEQTAF